MLSQSEVSSTGDQPLERLVLQQTQVPSGLQLVILNFGIVGGKRTPAKWTLVTSESGSGNEIERCDSLAHRQRTDRRHFCQIPPPGGRAAL